MSNWPKDNGAELDAFYSRADGSARWEILNLVYVACPWRVYTSWDPAQEYTKGIRIHKKCAESFKRVLADIWETYGKSQDAIKKAGMDRLGGSYYFRPKRGSRNLSLHAYGAAIDWDPVHNAMTKGNRGDMDPEVINCFLKEGWRWGGTYGDPMHFEAVDNNNAKPFPVTPLTPVTVTPVVVKPAPVVVAPVVCEPVVGVNKGPISDAGINLIKRWESFMPKPYDDRGHLAIGYGHTSKIGAPLVVAGMVIDEKQATDILINDLTGLYKAMKPFITVKLNGNQIGAIVSFAYNVGITNFSKSTLLKRINEKKFEEASKEFLKWNKSRNPKTKVLEVLAGLTKRRTAESELFLKEI